MPKSTKLSATQWRAAASLGSKLAQLNKRVSRRLASLRKAAKTQTMGHVQ